MYITKLRKPVLELESLRHATDAIYPVFTISIGVQITYCDLTSCHFFLVLQEFIAYKLFMLLCDSIHMANEVLVLLATAAFTLAVILSKLWKHSTSPTLPHIPGPIGLPFVGHLHLLCTDTPHKVLQRLSQRHGPILSLRYGHIPVVVASSTEAAREFLKVHDAAFASRPPVTIGRLFVNFSDIVFAPYGESWRHLRKIATLKLFTARRIEMFRSSRMDDVKWLCHSLVASSQRDEVVDVRGQMRALSFNFITFMLMGKRYFTDSGVKDEQGKRFVDVIEESILVGFFTTRDFFPWLPNFILDFAEKHIKFLAKSLDEFLGGDILEHENKMKNTASQDDFLGILLNLHDERVQKHDIKGVMTNLIIAGTDTSAVTLEWALAETVKHPAVAARAREEIDRVLGSEARTRMVEESDIPQLTYLQAIVKETLRLHPAVPLLLPHQSTEPVSDVMGYHIPCGTTVIINAYAISRDTSTWGDDALLFQPERFLETSVDIRGGNFEAIPFGSGRRQCPGMALGLQVIDITLANLLHGFEWREPKGKSIDTVNEKIGLTLVMANKLELIPTPRLGLDVLCPPRNQF